MHANWPVFSFAMQLHICWAKALQQTSGKGGKERRGRERERERERTSTGPNCSQHLFSQVMSLAVTASRDDQARFQKAERVPCLWEIAGLFLDIERNLKWIQLRECACHCLIESSILQLAGWESRPFAG